MKNWTINTALNHPKVVYWAMGVLTLVLTAFIPLIQIDTDPENMLPVDQPDRVFHNQVKQEFSLYDSIVVGAVNTYHPNGIFNAESLSALHRLTQHILTIDGVIEQDLMSLSTSDNIEQAGPGTIRFEWLMPQAPENEQAAQAIEKKVNRLPLALETLVSGDGKSAAIYVPIKSKDESHRISKEILTYIDQLNSDDEYHITGLPVAEDTFGFEMFVQMGISAPLAAVMIFIIMLLFFRSFNLVIAPMIVAMATVLSTMGLLIACGYTVHIMSSMIAIFLMPIAVVDSVHIMSEFADRYKPGRTPRDVAREVLEHLFKPMLFTSITSAVGFLSLLLTPIPPVQIFGFFVAFGILLAFILTILFMPAYISRMSEKKLEDMQAALHAHESDSFLARVLKSLGVTTVNYSKLILIAFIALFGVSVVGIQKIQINDNPVRWFKADHRIRIADEVLNHHFAGTYDAFLTLSFTGKDKLIQQQKTSVNALLSQVDNKQIETVAKQFLNNAIDTNELISRLDDLSFDLDGNALAAVEELISQLETYTTEAKYFTRPDVLAYMEQLQKHMDSTGLVGKSNAVTDLVKTVNRELYSGEDSDYKIPPIQAGVAQALLQFQSSHRPQDLWHMVNPDYSRALIWLQLTSGDNQDMNRVIDSVKDYVASHPLPEGMEYRWAGKTFINVVWQEAMVTGMLESLISAFVVVFIMMVVLFRSLLFGTLAMLPLTLTITFIYGLIGWIGKDYDMPIAVLSALTLGLSVDFAIHFLERARETFKQTGNFHEAMAVMFDEPANAISRNALVIALGFTPLLFAPLVPYITVGVFLASIMAASGLVTLMVLPAVLNQVKRFVVKTAN